MHEVMQRHHRFESVPLAGGEHRDVMIERREVERRRAVFVGTERARLHAAPLDAEAKRVQPQLAAPREILFVAMPEIGSRSRSPRHHRALLASAQLVRGSPTPL